MLQHQSQYSLNTRHGRRLNSQMMQNDHQPTSGQLPDIKATNGAKGKMSNETFSGRFCTRIDQKNYQTTPLIQLKSYRRKKAGRHSLLDKLTCKCNSENFENKSKLDRKGRKIHYSAIYVCIFHVENGVSQQNVGEN